MDTTKTVTHIGLCAGYGGIELGLQRAIPNLRTVALCEIEAFAVANLVAKMEAGLMDPAPIWPNLKTFPWESFRGCVDILSGGYPCQPFSSAGQRKGKDDPRHLWPWIADGIRLLQPRCCFFENVEGHISLGLSDVIEDLAGMGYRTTWGIFSAAECGAPHQRKRVFILAYNQRQRVKELGWEVAGASQLNTAWYDGDHASMDNSNTLAAGGIHRILGSSQGKEQSQGLQRERPRNSFGYAGQNTWPSRPGEQQYGWEPPRVISGRETLDDSEERIMRHDGDDQRQTVGTCDTTDNTSSCGGEAELGDSNGINGSAQAEGREHDRQAGSAGSRQAQSSLGGDADGTANRMDNAELYVSCDNRTDELRLLGNGVVPATAQKAFRVLINELLGA